MKTIATLGLLVLVVSMIFGGIPLSVEAQADPSILLKIASQAKRQIERQISNQDVPNEVQKLFEEGTAQVDSLKVSLEKDDLSSARKHFLSAMRIFKKISQLISQRPSVEAATSAAVAPRDLLSSLERMVKYLASLKTIAKRHYAGMDFSEIDRLIATAKTNIHEGNYDEAKKNIDQIKRLIIAINKTLHEQANQRKTDRAKDFAQKHLEKLASLIEEAKKQGYSLEIINKLEDAYRKLSETSDPHEIINQVRKIISIKEQFELTKIDRIEARVDQIEKKLERISQIEGIDPTQIKDAEQIFSEIKKLLSDDKHDDALHLLRTLSELLQKLENSIS